jgi:hypothetical protein
VRLAIAIFKITVDEYGGRHPVSQQVMLRPISRFCCTVEAKTRRQEPVTIVVAAGVAAIAAVDASHAATMTIKPLGNIG